VTTEATPLNQDWLAEVNTQLSWHWDNQLRPATGLPSAISRTTTQLRLIWL
jgi:hypothetical protein